MVDTARREDDGALGSRLAALLREQKQPLLREWSARVLADPRIPRARSLTETERLNQLPALLDSLADAADRGGDRDVRTEHAQEHARHRLGKGYPLEEVLRELAHLRAAFAALAEQEGVPLDGPAGSRVHALLDEVMIRAAIEVEETHAGELRREVTLRELLIGILGHDLRNPVTSVAFAAALLLRADDLPALRKRTVERIAVSAERIRRLIDDLLDMTRIRSGGGLPVAPRPTDLGAVCRQVIDELEQIYPGRSVIFTARGDTGGSFDPDRFAQVVSNLVGNALDYSPPATPVRADLEGREADVLFTVSNAGAPIPAEELATLFDSFRRGSQVAAPERPIKGLGLGLFIAREIVGAHGGTIHVTSGPGEPTRFTASLPR